MSTPVSVYLQPELFAGFDSDVILCRASLRACDRDGNVGVGFSWERLAEDFGFVAYGLSGTDCGS